MFYLISEIFVDVFYLNSASIKIFFSQVNTFMKDLNFFRIAQISEMVRRCHQDALNPNIKIGFPNRCHAV